MPDTPTVRPALTRDEWAHVDAMGPEGARTALPGVVALAADGPLDEQAAGYLHEAMALANAALPPGDEAKITREDVRLLRADADALRAGGVCANPVDAAASLDRIAEKLAAILPPEGR